MIDQMSISGYTSQNISSASDVSVAKVKEEAIHIESIDKKSKTETDVVEISAQGREALAKATAEKISVPQEAQSGAAEQLAAESSKAAQVGAMASSAAKLTQAESESTSSNTVLTTLSESQLKQLVAQGTITKSQADKELASRNADQKKVDNDQATEKIKNSNDQKIQLYARGASGQTESVQASVIDSVA